MEQSETPRTDEEEFTTCSDYCGSERCVFSEFARSLERELSEVTRERQTLIDYFRGDGFIPFGMRGDDKGWEPEQTAIEAMRECVELRRERNAPCCGEYFTCTRACTPRGKAAAERELEALRGKLEKRLDPVAWLEHDTEGKVIGVTLEPLGYWPTTPLYPALSVGRQG